MGEFARDAVAWAFCNFFSDTRRQIGNIFSGKKEKPPKLISLDLSSLSESNSIVFSPARSLSL